MAEHSVKITEQFGKVTGTVDGEVVSEGSLITGKETVTTALPEFDKDRAEAIREAIQGVRERLNSVD